MSLKILLVDSDSGRARMLERTLAEAGFSNVARAGGGADLVEAVRRLTPTSSLSTWRCRMTRWGLIEKGLPLGVIAERVYRPDLYAAALAPAGAPIPASDRKREGEHAADWSLPASPGPIALGRTSSATASRWTRQASGRPRQSRVRFLRFQPVAAPFPRRRPDPDKPG